MSGARRDAQHETRLAWLRARPALLARLPGSRDDVDGDRLAALDDALRAVRLVRLFAPSSPTDSVRAAIRRLVVSELRGEPTGPAYGRLP